MSKNREQSSKHKTSPFPYGGDRSLTRVSEETTLNPRDTKTADPAPYKRSRNLLVTRHQSPLVVSI